jgi:hypothetical protein
VSCYVVISCCIITIRSVSCPVVLSCCIITIYSVSCPVVIIMLHHNFVCCMVSCWLYYVHCYVSTVLMYYNLSLTLKLNLSNYSLICTSIKGRVSLKQFNTTCPLSSFPLKSPHYTNLFVPSLVFPKSLNCTEVSVPYPVFPSSSPFL